LGFAGYFCVARSHSNRGRFMAAVDIPRPIDSLFLKFGKCFPYRWPLGPRRGKDVVNTCPLENFDHRFATVHKKSSKLWNFRFWFRVCAKLETEIVSLIEQDFCSAREYYPK